MACLQLGSLGRGNNSSHPGAACDRWSVLPRSTKGTELSPMEDSSDDAEPMQGTEGRAFCSEPLQSCGGQAVPSSPNILFWLLCLYGAATSEEQTPGEGSSSKQNACGRGFCVAAVIVRAFQVHRQARQVGQRQQVKSAGYFLRKQQLKNQE